MAPDSTRPLNDQARLVASLRNPSVFGAGCSGVTLQETHISYVLLTGKYAYKIKKDVNLGFLDYTTLAARRHYCEQELQLNRRHAPALYLDVVAITGTIDRPVLGGDGPPLEYAVRMLEFSQDSLASRLLASGDLEGSDIDALAAKVAAFHARIDAAAPDSEFGQPDGILRLARQNFERIRPLLEQPEDIARLDTLAQWTKREHAARSADFAARKRDGFVRECHGDLHLNNIARIDGEITIFDCIEFNDSMRWIDVLSEVAFTVMDLEDHGRADLAQRFLNAYLEITGDYGGLGVLRFYVAYRAMVRAMVARLRAAQPLAADARRAALAEYDGYIAIAQSCARPPQPAIVLTHGLAGSGKTTLSQPLLELLRAVRIRTDVERKREHGLESLDRPGVGLDSGLYAPDATEALYRRVRELARGVIQAGYIVIVDAAFLKRWQRDLFRRLAFELEVPFAIVTFTATESSLRERIQRRAAAANDASDANLAVLDHQLRTQDVLAPDEQVDAVLYDSDLPLAHAREPSAWDAVIARIRAPGPRDPERAVPDAGDPGIRAKVDFLSAPAAYAEPTAHVDVVETHLSWVFLTGRYAWKLKKPVRTQDVDFNTMGARRSNCSEQLRLNGRQSDSVYLDVVPLAVDAGGRLRLGTEGRTVDWLVRMRRLPSARMLDRLLREGVATSEDLRRVVIRLARFYCASPPVELGGDEYRAKFLEGIAQNERELGNPARGLPAERVAAISAQQRAVLERQPELFDRRLEAGRIVEAHGDLRPEHICLEDPPQIIDCLEFSRALRVLDAADELSFLALECERLGGAPAFKATIFDAYAEVTGDRPPEALLRFYRGYRACIRAKLAIRHLDDAPRAPSKWIAQARSYLELAWRCGDRLS